MKRISCETQPQSTKRSALQLISHLPICLTKVNAGRNIAINKCFSEQQCANFSSFIYPFTHTNCDWLTLAAPMGSLGGMRGRCLARVTSTNPGRIGNHPTARLPLLPPELMLPPLSPEVQLARLANHRLPPAKQPAHALIAPL